MKATRRRRLQASAELEAAIAAHPHDFTKVQSCNSPVGKGPDLVKRGSVRSETLVCVTSKLVKCEVLQKFRQEPDICNNNNNTGNCKALCNVRNIGAKLQKDCWAMCTYILKGVFSSEIGICDHDSLWNFQFMKNYVSLRNGDKILLVIRFDCLFSSHS